MRGIRFTYCFIIGLMLAAGSALRAQSNSPAPGAQQRPQAPSTQSPAISGMAIGGPFGVLTDEQRISYQALMKAAHGQLAEMDAKLRAARQDLLVTSVSGPFDEKVMHEKALVAARIEADMVVLRAKLYSEVQPPLTPEQVEKIKSGQTAPPRAMDRPMIRREASTSSTNHDANGLPPKQ